METSAKTKWAVDAAHSAIAFKVKHMMISTVRGHFENFRVNAETGGDDFKNADISVEIDVDSIQTGNKDRENHLRSDDFFNASEYPLIRFSSSSFDGEKLTGELTIRDVTRTTLPEEL